MVHTTMLKRLRLALGATALLSLALPVLAQDANRPLPPAQLAFDQRLDAVMPALSPSARYQVTQQGLAEFITLQEALMAQGSVSENGWVIDCSAAHTTVAEWVDATQTITGVALGAAWWEHIGLICRPEQPTSWTTPEIRRLAQASDRASRDLPSDWKAAASVYRRGPVERYLRRLNRSASLDLRNRRCEQGLVAEVQANRLSVPEAWGRQKACPLDPKRPSVSDDGLLERYPDAPLATLVATPFMGVERWASRPMLLAPLLNQPGNYGRLFLDMASVFPVPPVIHETEAVWIQAYQAAEPGPEKDAFSALFTAERKPLVSLAVALSSKAPSKEECARLGEIQRTGLEQLRHPSSWGPFLQNWQTIGVVCPQQALTKEELPALEANWKRTWQDMGTTLSTPVPAFPVGVAQQWWDQHAPAASEERLSCLRQRVSSHLAAGYPLSEGWMAARAWCAPAYQTQFSTSENAP